MLTGNRFGSVIVTQWSVKHVATVSLIQTIGIKWQNILQTLPHSFVIAGVSLFTLSWESSFHFRQIDLVPELKQVEK